MKLDLKALASKVAPIEQSTTMLVEEVQNLLPDMVFGREMHIDGDSAAYKCSGKDGTPLTTCKKRFSQFIEDKRLAAGAEFVNLCFTGGDGSKGGRYTTAVTKPYQETRVGTQRPENLPELRAWALNEYAGKAMDITDFLESEGYNYFTGNIRVLETSEEADDTMTQLHQIFKDKGLHDLSVICAEDKDLFMNDGLFLDWSTHELRDCPTPYGHIEHYQTPSGTNKIIGAGKAFFFAQLLTGDTADNIPGLPYFTSALAATCFPSSELREQKRRYTEQTMPSGKALTPTQSEAVKEKISKLVASTKSKSCGPVAVLEYLEECRTEREAFDKVLRAYCAYYGKDEEVYNPHTEQTEIWQPLDFMIEQGRLLWMRRYFGEDVTDYFKEIVHDKTT